MLCVSCGVCERNLDTSLQLCRSCYHSLRPAPARRLDNGLVIRSAYHHEGAARTLVHRLKYGAMIGIAELLVGQLAPLVPPQATVLVPIPRVVARRIRYGVDPAGVLSTALAKRCGLEVVPALTAPLWAPRHAGKSRSRRTPWGFASHVEVPVGAVMVDDVVTTGSTLSMAVRAIEGLGGNDSQASSRIVVGAVTVSSAIEPNRGSPRAGNLSGSRFAV